MTAALAILGVLAGGVGALGFYLASANQKLLARSWSLRTGLSAGAVGTIVSLAAFLRITGPATAVYLLLTLAMLVWSLVPLLLGWWRYRRERQA